MHDDSNWSDNMHSIISSSNTRHFWKHVWSCTDGKSTWKKYLHCSITCYVWTLKCLQVPAYVLFSPQTKYNGKSEAKVLPQIILKGSKVYHVKVDVDFLRLPRKGRRGFVRRLYADGPRPTPWILLAGCTDVRWPVRQRGRWAIQQGSSLVEPRTARSAATVIRRVTTLQPPTTSALFAASWAYDSVVWLQFSDALAVQKHLLTPVFFMYVLPLMLVCIISCLLINEHLIWFDLIWFDFIEFCSSSKQLRNLSVFICQCLSSWYTSPRTCFDRNQTRKTTTRWTCTRR